MPMRGQRDRAAIDNERQAIGVCGNVILSKVGIVCLNAGKRECYVSDGRFHTYQGKSGEAGGSEDWDIQMQHASICTSVSIPLNDSHDANSLAETSGMAAVEMSFSRIGTPTDRAYSRPALDNANENPGLVDWAFTSAATGNGKFNV